MPLPKSFIIVKGEPKALQIEKIRLEDNWVYAIKYTNSPTTFHYRYNDVVWLKNAVWHDHQNLKIYIGGREQFYVTDIRSFQDGDLTHWRITFNDNYVKDYLHGSIQVVKNCLSDEKSKNVFEYLKRIAEINELGKDEEHGGLLSSLYGEIDFIDENMAFAPYLDNERHKVKTFNAPPLIFPFGCNSSQEKAVINAFENQISVIQGPPGTGKTQTILNIIANILMQEKTVMVVSNNNSATANVLEKMQKYGLDFVVAPLGKRENKEAFINNQPPIPNSINSWRIPKTEKTEKIKQVFMILSELRRVCKNQDELAIIKQELKALSLEWQHFQNDNKINENTYLFKRIVSSKKLMKLWLQYQSKSEEGKSSRNGFFSNLIERIRWMWIDFSRKYITGITTPFNKNNIYPLILELQTGFYISRLSELEQRINKIESDLKTSDAKILSERLTDTSLSLLKNMIFEKYHQAGRRFYNNVGDLRLFSGEVCKQYPVILSTTFSARTSIPEQTYDFIIMDEASQVSIETGALALTCAKNAVIVGDTMQLPNVITNDDRLKLNGIFEEYKVPQGFHCADNSFLRSVCTIIPDVKQTLLREHYRCHPTIINFCNQRFYSGNLIIMTKDNHEKDVMMAIKTVPGQHSRGHYNQREIDVVKTEILPQLEKDTDTGIISPYNEQVDAFNRQIPSITAATIHKYQGREKDTIIMSLVDDQITEFSDDPNLINVAISRAKERFHLVLSGNEQERKGNINDLVEYIEYNNFTVRGSCISSIFDYLYTNYTNERMAFLAQHKHVSEYDSENLTFSLLENIVSEYPEFHHLGILCHTPLWTIIRDWSMLNDEEKKYISHYSTHLDFLIINHVTKKPVMAIETDGYSYHNDKTEQHKRDLMKNHILELYSLPLLRLRTNESGEKEKVTQFLLKTI